MYGAEVKRLPLPPIESDLSMGKTCSLVAFHLNGILALYMASTSTLSPTCGLDPFTQQLKQTFTHFKQLCKLYFPLIKILTSPALRCHTMRVHLRTIQDKPSQWDNQEQVKTFYFL